MSELVIPVGDAAEYIRTRADRDGFLPQVWIEGEVGSAAVRRGHCYFKLKDDRASLDCIVFRYETTSMAGLIENGRQILLRGDLSFYPSNGRLSILGREAREVGRGEQQERLLELGRKLMAEGCFESSRKRQLPPFPRTVAIVTSAQGKARHDFDKIAMERDPSVRRLLYPTLVQGKDAPRSIAAALTRAALNPEIDVLVVGRGGGDPSELQAFNTAEVVYAVVNSRIPVVSAVGHEADTTFCDLAADVRASTPSNAAEIVIPERSHTLREIDELRRRLKTGVDQQVRIRRHELAEERTALGAQGIMWRLSTARGDVRSFRQKSQGSVNRLLSDKRGEVAQVHMLVQRVRSGVDRLLADKRQQVARCEALVKANNPTRLVAQGYAVVIRDGSRISRAADLHAGDRVQLMFADGTVSVTVQIPQEKSADE